MDIPFVHLHCHSHYSLLDGAGKVEDLLKRAKDLEMPALALTDHGNLYGALEFYQKAQACGIKPIIGFEAYIAPGSRLDKSGGSSKEASFHLTLLATNKTGYQNLLKLSSSAFIEGMYYKPRIDKELLTEFNEGLICLSGCASSEISRAILHAESDGIEKARKIAEWYRNLFGDRYYLEIQDNGLEIQKIILEGTLNLARELGIPTVATNDVHYVYQNDAEAQDILLCVNTGKLRSDEKRMRMDSDQFFLRSGREMLQAMPAHEDAIQRTIEIADRVNIDLELNKHYLPVFIPPDGLSSIDYLRKLCLEGLARRYADNPKRYKDGQFSDEVITRLDRELAVIEKQGFPNYFLIVWDFVRVAEERGIHRTARGSGVGALVCYALNLSHVCPLEFDLLFERFLDVERKEMPDIDIDFDQDRRIEILNYVKEKYTEANVAQLGTFGTMAAKQSINDVGRVLNFPIQFVKDVTKLVPERPKITIEKALAESEELKKRYNNESEIKELIDYARQIEGLARNTGVHACGVIIADKPLTEYVPLLVDKKDGIVTQWQGADVEKAGLLKMDFLGLRNLTILAHAIHLVKETTGKTIDPYKFPLDDKETYDLLCRGETRGIFQLEGGGIRELLQRMKPDNFRDIIATLALYRPGPLEGGMVDQYVEVKHGRKQAEYDHEVMKDVLAETNGVMVYQEQIMRILNRLGKIPLGNAYSCIKAISKKKDFSKYREQFIEGAKENGLAKDKASDIFELIIKFAGYGFNKSHSTAYALVAYMTAYLKAHYSIEFMAALLCGDISGRNFASKDATVEHIEDCQRLGIGIIPPDVNTSKQLYSIVDGKISFAITAIKSCGDWAADKIVQAREKGGRFKNLFDFCERVDNRACSRATVETLIKAGAFDSFGCYRSQLIQMLDQAFKSAQSAAADIAKGQKSLLSMLDNDDDEPAATAKTAALVDLPDIPEWSDKEKATHEKEVLGFYLSSHPLKEYDAIFKQFRSHSCQQATSLPERTDVILAGTIGDIKISTTKNPKPGKPNQFAMFALEDAGGSIRSIIWPDQYYIYSHLVKSESLVFAVGRIDRSRSQSENDGNFIIDELYAVDEAEGRLARGLGITIDEQRHPVENVKKLYEILRGSPGQGVVELSVKLQNGALAQFKPAKLRIEMKPELRQHVIRLLGDESVRLLKLPPKKREERRKPWQRD